ncbi:MAG: transposase, partial [Rhizomicrobium sp.]
DFATFTRTLALPEAVKHWSLASLREKLVKIGAKIVAHARYLTFQIAEAAVPSRLIEEMLRLIHNLRPRPGPA